MFETAQLYDEANKIPRWLGEESNSSSSKQCFIWRKVAPGSMNLTDMNTT